MPRCAAAANPPPQHGSPPPCWKPTGSQLTPSLRLLRPQLKIVRRNVRRRDRGQRPTATKNPGTKSLLRIRSSAKKTFGETFGAATGVSDAAAGAFGGGPFFLPPLALPRLAFEGQSGVKHFSIPLPTPLMATKKSTSAALSAKSGQNVPAEAEKIPAPPIHSPIPAKLRKSTTAEIEGDIKADRIARSGLNTRVRGHQMVSNKLSQAKRDAKNDRSGE